jgi:hypothetical protein
MLYVYSDGQWPDCGWGGPRGHQHVRRQEDYQGGERPHLQPGRKILCVAIKTAFPGKIYQFSRIQDTGKGSAGKLGKFVCERNGWH